MANREEDGWEVVGREEQAGGGCAAGWTNQDTTQEYDFRKNNNSCEIPSARKRAQLFATLSLAYAACSSLAAAIPSRALKDYAQPAT